MKAPQFTALSISAFLGCVATIPAYSTDSMVACRIFGSWRECASIARASDMEEKQAKELGPPSAEKAKLYVVRSGLVAASLPTSVSLDQKDIAYLAPDTFITLEISPGKHQLDVVTFSGDQIENDFKGGVSYFYKVNLGINFHKRSEHIATISRSEIQGLMAQLHMAKIKQQTPE